MNSDKAAPQSLLRVRDLKVALHETPYIDIQELDVHAHEILAVVGESGSGKSLMLASIIGLAPAVAHISGDFLFCDRTTPRLGTDVGVIWQDTGAALHPLKSIAAHLRDALLSSSDVHEKSIAALQQAGLGAEVLPRFPHQLSGGMRQRVLIAMGLANTPSIILADEPTAALDASHRHDVLSIFRNARDAGAAIIWITHSLRDARQWSDNVLVLYAGRVVESGPATILDAPKHPYTQALMSASLRCEVAKEKLVTINDHAPPVNALPSGCRFHPRCNKSVPECAAQTPTLQGSLHKVACPLALSET